MVRAVRRERPTRDSVPSARGPFPPMLRGGRFHVKPSTPNFPAASWPLGPGPPPHPAPRRPSCVEAGFKPAASARDAPTPRPLPCFRPTRRRQASHRPLHPATPPAASRTSNFPVTTSAINRVQYSSISSIHHRCRSTAASISQVSAPIRWTISSCSAIGGTGCFMLPIDFQSALGILAPNVELVIACIADFERRNISIYPGRISLLFDRSTKNSPTHTPLWCGRTTFAK